MTIHINIENINITTQDSQQALDDLLSLLTQCKRNKEEAIATLRDLLKYDHSKDFDNPDAEEVLDKIFQGEETEAGNT